MRSNIVLTLTGRDRVGIVEEVTKALLEIGANVETSRMARLGGEFAMLVLVSAPAEKAGELDAIIAGFAARGFQGTATPTEEGYAEGHPGWTTYRVEVDGADHEGIVHEIAAGLSRQGISIESMETGVVPAPVSGALLFQMSALVVVPPGLTEADWLTVLDEAGRQSNVDVKVSAI